MAGIPRNGLSYFFSIYGLDSVLISEVQIPSGYFSGATRSSKKRPGWEGGQSYICRCFVVVKQGSKRGYPRYIIR